MKKNFQPHTKDDSLLPSTIASVRPKVVVVGQAHSELHSVCSRHSSFHQFYNRVKRGVKWEKFYCSGPTTEKIFVKLLHEKVFVHVSDCRCKVLRLTATEFTYKDGANTFLTKRIIFFFLFLNLLHHDGQDFPFKRKLYFQWRQFVRVM